MGVKILREYAGEEMLFEGRRVTGVRTEDETFKPMRWW
jgi:hypothetical protein